MKKLERTSQIPPKEIVNWLKNKRPSKIRRHYLINELGACCQNRDDPQGFGENYLLKILKDRGKKIRILAYYNLANQSNDKYAEFLAEFRNEPRNSPLLTKIDRLLTGQDSL